MGKLTDILNAGGQSGDGLKEAWGSTEAATDYDALPAGEYIAHIITGELSNSRTNGTPGYKLVFKVLQGPGDDIEFAGRQFWHDIWLTRPAMPMAKRDLGKLGVTDLEQLEKPLPLGFRCSVKLALRRDDDGTERNRVKQFNVIGIDEPERDPFAPPKSPETQTEANVKELDETDDDKGATC